VEGGKGVAVSNGLTAGAWAAAGGVGTFSAVNAGQLRRRGAHHPPGLCRQDPPRAARGAGGLRHRRGIAQAREAREVGGRDARIHANILWEMGGAERVIRGVLEGAKGLVNGITCGAGMPYRLAEIARDFSVHYYPIVSSARAFNALWRRSYSKVRAVARRRGL
jgi:hypothetical protein